MEQQLLATTHSGTYCTYMYNLSVEQQFLATTHSGTYRYHLSVEQQLLATTHSGTYIQVSPERGATTPSNNSLRQRAESTAPHGSIWCTCTHTWPESTAPHGSIWCTCTHTWPESTAPHGSIWCTCTHTWPESTAPHGSIQCTCTNTHGQRAQHHMALSGAHALTYGQRAQHHMALRVLASFKIKGGGDLNLIWSNIQPHTEQKGANSRLLDLIARSFAGGFVRLRFFVALEFLIQLLVTF